MSLFEAAIIYLSAGAPFGVLVFFSQRRGTRTALLFAIAATLAWPIIGFQRLFRSVSRRNDRKQPTIIEENPREVLQNLLEEVPVEAAELFEIAGHSNPWLATNCYARSRKSVIRSHIERLETPPVHLVNTAETESNRSYASTTTAVAGS